MKRISIFQSLLCSWYFAIGFYAHNIDILEKCCGLIKDGQLENSSSIVADLLLEHSKDKISKQKFTKKISLVTYITPSIYDYASYSLVINSAFSKINDYPFVICSPDSGDEYEPRDQRWNRVKIIENAFDPATGYLRDFDYVVWIDADLIFLDMKFQFESIIAQYEKSDIIISSERHSETGVANTGCFIMKNTLWSREFLKDWWNLFDRSLNHDQIFFDKLYKLRLASDVREHVTILPIEILNSIPPPMLYQKPSHQILHLMGEKSELRQTIFSIGLTELCESYLLKRSPQNQLGLSQPILQNVTIHIFNKNLNNLLNLIQINYQNYHYHQINSQSIHQQKQIVDLISETREIMLQLQKYTPSKCIECSQERLQRLLSMNEILSAFIDPLINKNGISKSQIPPQFVLELLQLGAIVGNDIINENLTEESNKIELFSNIYEYLQLLMKLVHPSGVIIVEEMLSSLHQSKAIFYQSKNQFAEALEEMYLAITILKKHNEKGNKHRLIQPLHTFAMFQCLAGDRAAGLSTFQELVEVQDQLLYAEEQWKEDHMTLGITLLNAAMCAIDGSEIQLAAAYANRCLVLFDKAPDKSELSYYINIASDLKERTTVDPMIKRSRSDVSGGVPETKDPPSPKMKKDEYAGNRIATQEEGDVESNSEISLAEKVTKKKIFRRKKKKIEL